MQKSKFAYVLRCRRKEKILTQTQLGEKIDVHPKRISAYERGERVPSRTIHQKLESELGKLPRPRKCRWLKDNCRWRDSFRDNGAWRPSADRSPTSLLKTARLTYTEHMPKLEETAARRAAWLETAAHGSSLELLSSLLMFDSQGARELGVRLLAWGFRKLPIFDNLGGGARGDYKFAGIGLPLVEEGRTVGRIVVVNQVPVQCGDRFFKLDMVIGIRVGRKRLWLVGEIDGPGHCSHEDELRARYIDVIRFTQAEILAPGFVEEFKRRVRALLPTKRMRAAA